MSTASRRYFLPGENRLIAAMPAPARAELTLASETVRLGLKALLFEGSAPITHVYFPLSGVMSLVIRMSDGGTVEVGTIGNEGFVGTPVLLGAERSPTEAFCQVPGEALKIPVPIFKAAVERHAGLNHLARRYTQALVNQISQTTACNHLHSVQERLCRWLLMTHDRVGKDELLLTQEFIAQMLGVRRATVTVVAGILQEAKLIQYRRGRITVLDRPRLEESSCECYEIVRNEYDRMFEETQTPSGRVLAPAAAK